MSCEEDFEDFDDEYLAELDNLNKNFTFCEDDITLQDSVTKNVIPSRTSDDYDYSRSLVATEDEDDIDSEEEKDILKGIRDEIEIKVRDEMKDELQVYQSQLLALEAGEHGGAKPEKGNGEETTRETQENEDEKMDPKLKEALTKMRKLDRILMKKIRREKEVKRERLLMEKRLREEVSQMRHGATHFSEIKMNTEKFLALSAPLSHNSGISLEDLDSDLPPLFQTEIDDTDIKKRGKQNSQEDTDTNNLPQQNSGQSSSVNESSRNGSSASKSGNKEKTPQSKKDFIQRNRELAAASNEVVAMTDDEKKRLNELLEDINDLPEMEEDLDDASNVDFQLTLNAGVGFLPDVNEFRSLSNIDSRLRSVMADDDYKSVIGSSVQSTPRQPLFTRVGDPTSAQFLDGFGERVLYETKEERDLKARLQAIEKELEGFTAPQEMEESPEDFHLTDEQLDKLLDQCARSTPHVSVMESPDVSARSNVSSRQALLANPPKLSDEQLQKLLSEAHFPMSSQLMALREDDEKIMEGDGTTETIRAETWKAIVDENLDLDNDEGAESLTCDEEIHPYVSNQNNNHGRSVGDGGGQENFTSFSECDRTNISHSYSTNITNTHAVSGEDCASVSSNNSNSAVNSSLPRITPSNTLPRQSQSESNRSSCASPTSIRESSNVSVDSVRFPKISSNSFLIHIPQGLNNEPEKSMTPVLARPLKMVHNDLSEMKLDSFSEDERDIKDRRFQKRNSSLIPQPPPGSKGSGKGNC